MSNSTIKLHTILIDHDGDQIIKNDKVRTLPRFLKMTDDEFKASVALLTREELLKLAPKFTLGDGLKSMLVNIQAKDVEQSAYLYSIITSLNNKLMTEKGEWTKSKEELKKLIELLKELKSPTTIIAGQVFSILELALANSISSQDK